MSEEQAETLARPWEGSLTQGELRYQGSRLFLYGRTLRLILWIAARQRHLNLVAPDCGQIWITWKGEAEDSISGDIRTPL